VLLLGSGTPGPGSGARGAIDGPSHQCTGRPSGQAMTVPGGECRGSNGEALARLCRVTPFG